MKIGVQTYTIRKDGNIDSAEALRRVKELGFDSIELAYFPLTQGTFDAIRESGLYVHAIQAPYRTLMKDVEHVIGFASQAMCSTVVVSVLSLQAIVFGKQAIIRFAHRLNALNKTYQKSKIRLAFHHHDFEFKSIRGIKKLDILLEHLDPTIGIVTDTYWTKKAGFDPLSLMISLGNRLIGVHLRDYDDMQRKDTSIGQGSIDFESILAYIETLPVYQVIEQNTMTPYPDLEKSIHHLQKIKGGSS